MLANTLKYAFFDTDVSVRLGAGQRSKHSNVIAARYQFFQWMNFTWGVRPLPVLAHA